MVAGLGVLAALAADQVLRRAEAIVVGVFVATAGLDLLEGTARALRGGDVDVALPMVGQLGTALSLAVALFAIARPRRDPPGRALWLGAMAYLGGSILTDVLVGAGVQQHLVILALLLTALWVAPTLDVHLVVRTLQVVTGAALVLSLVLWLAGAPGAAGPYDGLVPGLGVRVKGITQHANHLGPLTVLYLALEHLHPTPRRIRLAMVATSLTLLVAAQSKTAWLMAGFVALVLAAVHERGRRARPVLASAAVAAAAGALLLGVSLDDVVPADELESAQNLTGRTDLWQVGVDEWRASDPLLGAGTGVFKEHARRTDQSWAGQAHNQAIQSLAEHGLVGVAVLLLYAGLLVVSALRTSPASRGVTLGLTGALLLRSLTETPLDQSDPLHLAVVALLLAFERQRVDVDRGAAAPVAAVTGRREPAVAGTG